jgi:F-type H+-transporting ATPase subunit b
MCDSPAVTGPGFPVAPNDPFHPPIMHLEILPLLAAATDPNTSAVSGGIEAVKQVLGPFGVEPILLLAQIINFGIVAAIVYYFAIKPVLATVDERNKKIAEGLKYTEDVKKKLDDTERQQAEVLKQASAEGKKLIAEARETSKALVEKASGDATRSAEDIMKKGQQAIALEREQMLGELRREVGQLVVNTANRVLGHDLTPEERARFTASAAQDLTKN